MSKVKLFLSCFLIITIAGCCSLSRSEKEMLRELKSYGISETQEQIKHPGLAGGLNLLPGVGNFYLAYGTEESEMWAIGFVNLLLWPWSAAWGIPEAAIDANNINKRETVYYYKFDHKGKKEYENLKTEHTKHSSSLPE